MMDLVSCVCVCTSLLLRHPTLNGSSLEVYMSSGIIFSTMKAREGIQQTVPIPESVFPVRSSVCGESEAWC